MARIPEKVGFIPGRWWESVPDFVNDWDVLGYAWAAEFFDKQNAFWRAVAWVTDTPLGIATFYLTLFALWFVWIRRSRRAMSQKNFSWLRAAGVLLLLFLFMGVSELVANAWLKESFGKMKPNIIRYVEGSKPPLSFPSAHAFNTSYVVFLLSLGLWQLGQSIWLRVLVTGLCVATLVALSRLVFGVHFPSDIVGGFLMGGLLGALLSPLWARAWKKFLA